MGHGVVGGSMMPIDEVVRVAADAATRLLNGAPPKSINLPLPRPGQPIFDWRELRRWGIAESRLPAGSVVRYRSPGLWQEHKLMVLGSIGALAHPIAPDCRPRVPAPRAAAGRERQPAAPGARRRRQPPQTMSALTTSIAHELGQPLSSMIHNADALRAMIDADRAPSDTMREILTDIRAQSVQAAQIIERHRAMLRSHQLTEKADRRSRRRP